MLPPIEIRKSANPTPNITRNLTGGLVRLFNKIRTRDKSYPCIENFTKSDGFLRISDELPLLNSRYRAISVIGEGTFSQLVLAEDTFSPKHRKVALKIMNTKYAFIGIQECQKVVRLNALDPENQSSIVRLLDSFFFYFNDHLCLVLELLDCSLLSYMKRSSTPVPQVRKIAIQLVSAFAFLRQSNVIHGDLKPENVLLRPRATGINHSHVQVKLIDFGNAMSQEEVSFYYDDFDVQTLYYRAPEVLLGVPFSFPIDMWSLGCLIVELRTGKPLFSCQSNQDLFHTMLKVLGPFPAYLRSGKFAKRHFTNPVFIADESLSSVKTSSLSRLNNLAKILHSNDLDFVSFVGGLLEYHPDNRLTPTQALYHKFFSPLFPFKLILADQASPQTPPRPQNQQQQLQSQSQSQSQLQLTQLVPVPQLSPASQLVHPQIKPPSPKAFFDGVMDSVPIPIAPVRRRESYPYVLSSSASSTASSYMVSPSSSSSNISSSSNHTFRNNGYLFDPRDATYPPTMESRVVSRTTTTFDDRFRGHEEFSQPPSSNGNMLSSPSDFFLPYLPNMPCGEQNPYLPSVTRVDNAPTLPSPTLSQSNQIQTQTQTQSNPRKRKSHCLKTETPYSSSPYAHPQLAPSQQPPTFTSSFSQQQRFTLYSPVLTRASETYPKTLPISMSQQPIIPYPDPQRIKRIINRSL